ncbi:MAG: hypothetical protein OEZ68_21720 [Gammaproteobacteria bacterium]|nr:hypothetical protein [Gammaproteobacteria bacterium]MDH5803417.1 hypothetical protein [Gammaproteobacteria bacterium]
MIKSSSIRIRIDPDLHSEFLTTCRNQDKPAAQVLREFMREYVAKYPPVEQRELFVAEEEIEYK